jgi:hypothetical protein
MTTQEAVRYFGTQLKLCEALGLNARQTIHAWGEYPPVGRQYQLEVITNGKLRAERQTNALTSSVVA